jgi:hypothetical protein
MFIVSVKRVLCKKKMNKSCGCWIPTCTGPSSDNSQTICTGPSSDNSQTIVRDHLVTIHRQLVRDHLVTIHRQLLKDHFDGSFLEGAGVNKSWTTSLAQG